MVGIFAKCCSMVGQIPRDFWQALISILLCILCYLECRNFYNIPRYLLFNVYFFFSFYVKTLECVKKEITRNRELGETNQYTTKRWVPGSMVNALLKRPPTWSHRFSAVSWEVKAFEEVWGELADRAVSRLRSEQPTEWSELQLTVMLARKEEEGPRVHLKMKFIGQNEKK